MSFNNFLERQTNKLRNSILTFSQKEKSKNKAVNKTSLTQFLLSLRSGRIYTQSLFVSPQRLEQILWLKKICNHLPEHCFESAIIVFDELNARFRNDKPFYQTAMLASLFAVSHQLNCRFNYTFGLDQELIIGLQEEAQQYILPQLDLNDCISSQIKETATYLKNQKQIILLGFLSELRFLLPCLLRQPTDIQILTCLLTSELLIYDCLKDSWNSMLELSKRQKLDDYGHAMLRKQTQALFNSISQLDWTNSYGWPRKWFLDNCSNFQTRYEIINQLGRLKNIETEIQLFSPSNIWLLAPSVILEEV